MCIEEATADELLSSLEDSNVVLESRDSERTGSVTVRKTDDTYYCDTSVKLYTTQDSSELLAQLEGLGIPMGRGESSGA